MPINSFLYPGVKVFTPYEVANSLRFDDGSSDNLTRTPSSTGDRQKFTFSTWVKRANLSSDTTIFASRSDANNNSHLTFNSSNQLFLKMKIGGSSTNLTTNQLFRDVSAWLHIVLSVDTTQGTSSNRQRLYVNGTEITSFSASAYPSQNANTPYNWSSATNYIGTESTSQFLDGYLAETVLVDGQALDPTSFGEFDSDTGIWKPIDVSGLTFGTNGFYLDFENSSSLGADVSGNGNNFTVNNLTSIDQSTDTCTNNFATYNPIFGMGRQDQLTYSEGNTVVVSGATSGTDTTATSTFAFDSGKWYAEFKLTNDADGVYIGVATSNFNFTNSGVDTSAQSENWIVRGDDGTVRNNGSTAYFGTSFSNDDIIQIAIDMDNSKIWWGLNGTYANSGNPATGSNPAFSNLSGELMIIVGDNFSSRTPTIKANFGSPAFSISSGNSDGNGYGNFEYSVPSGYYSLCTKNLAEYG